MVIASYSPIYTYFFDDTRLNNLNRYTYIAESVLYLHGKCIPGRDGLV